MWLYNENMSAQFIEQIEISTFTSRSFFFLNYSAMLLTLFVVFFYKVLFSFILLGEK